MASPFITLTTDFGVSDGYIGAMKGVLLGINPEATIVDFSHDVPPQDIAYASFVLGTTYSYFCADTIHVAIVDPGVGTTRRPLLVVAPVGRFVVPDNGLITYVMPGSIHLEERDGLSQTSVIGVRKTALPEDWTAYVLDEPQYWRRVVSATFHGRDMFAPVAAHLSLGVSPTDMGTPVLDVMVFDTTSPTLYGETLYGEVIFVDRFGNLITNMTRTQLSGDVSEVEIGGVTVKGLNRSYAEEGGILALFGSHGYLEIAERNGNAAQSLGVKVGATVLVRS